MHMNNAFMYYWSMNDENNNCRTYWYEDWATWNVKDSLLVVLFQMFYVAKMDQLVDNLAEVITACGLITKY